MTKKYKVLMVGPARSVHGGISGVVNNYYEAGLDKKIDLTYIGTMVEGSKLRKLLQAATALVHFCLIVNRYQIVHVNVASDNSYYRKTFFMNAAKLFGKKLVIHQHGGNFEDFYENQLDDAGREKVRKTLSKGDAFLVLAPKFKTFFSDILEQPDKITVLPNTIPINMPEDKQYGQQKILYLGRICKEKGIDELIDSMIILKEKYPKVHLYLGGIWEDKELEKRVRKYSDFITYLGWIGGEEKKKYLKDCDIFVLPSYFEGQPVSVLEAMAAKCAIAATDVGGIPQMITNKENGILVSPKDREALTDGLDGILSDKELCRKFGANAYEKVKAEFSIDKSIEDLLQIYQKVSEVS